MYTFSARRGEWSGGGKSMFASRAYYSRFLKHLLASLQPILGDVVSPRYERARGSVLSSPLLENVSVLEQDALHIGNEGALDEHHVALCTQDVLLQHGVVEDDCLQLLVFRIDPIDAVSVLGLLEGIALRTEFVEKGLPIVGKLPVP